MTDANQAYEDEYSEYDEFDDDDDRGLSGFSVLIIGLVMIGAFFSVAWIAYQQGMKRQFDGAQTPFVAADPEPIKIETASNNAPDNDREVYDVFDGEDAEPVTVLAEGPEEPVDRSPDDPIGSIVANTKDGAGDTIADLAAGASQEAQDRIAQIAEEDAEVLDNSGEADQPDPVTVTQPIPASITPAANSATSGDAMSGSHVVQVGSFRSDVEAMTQWARLQTKLGDYAASKATHIEVADLGERGVYHRLRIGPFTSSDAASAYCAGLKERGQDCLPKRK